MSIITGSLSIWAVLACGPALYASLGQGPDERLAGTVRDSSVCLHAAMEWASEAVDGPGPDAGRRRLPTEEPSEYDDRELKAYYDWRNDLFFREFDLHQRGVADFMTARRTYKTWTDEFGTPIVITMANPLFYWVDLDADGEFEPQDGEMWSDPEEDGLNGNERLYGLHESTPPGPAAPPTPIPPSWQEHRTPIIWHPTGAVRGERLEHPRHV